MRRIIRIVIYTALGGTMAIVAVLFLLYRHTPGWYRPLRLTEPERQEASTGLTSRFTHFSSLTDTGREGQPIVLELSQDEANRFLQALPLVDERARLPAGLTDPVIVFRKDRLILAARHARVGERPVSLHMKVRIEPDQVAVVIESVDVGSLGLPRRLIEDTLSEFQHRLARSADAVGPRDRSDQARVVRELTRLGQAFFAAVNGQPMAREFPSQQTGRTIRLEALELEEGRIRLTFLPLGPPSTWGEHVPKYETEGR